MFVFLNQKPQVNYNKPQLQMAQQSVSQQSTSQQQMSRQQTGQQFPQQQIISRQQKLQQQWTPSQRSTNLFTSTQSLYLQVSFWCCIFEFKFFYPWSFIKTKQLFWFAHRLNLWINLYRFSSLNELNIHIFISSFNQWIFINLFLPPMNIHKFISSFNQWKFINLFPPSINKYS